jgi:hypothetical protein
LFKGKEAANEKAIIKILGTRESTTWDLSKAILIQGQQAHPGYKPSYDQIRNKNTIVYRRIKQLVSDQYVRLTEHKVTKGNEVALYGLTFKGFIAAVYLSEEKDVANIIKMNYDSLVKEKETSEVQKIATKFLLDFWKRICSKDRKVFDHFLRTPINSVKSTYDFQSLSPEDLIFHLMEIVCGDLLAFLGKGSVSVSGLRESLIKMLEEDIQLVDSVTYAIDWYFIKKSLDLDDIYDQVCTTLDRVFPNESLETRKYEAYEVSTKDEIIKRLERLRRTKISINIGQ